MAETEQPQLSESANLDSNDQPQQPQEEEQDEEVDQHVSDSEAILEDMKQITIDTQRQQQEQQQGQEHGVSITATPTVIEDFIRNFLISNAMHESLDIFQREWYSKLQREDELTAIAKIPDIYMQKEKLESTVKEQQEKLHRLESVTQRVKATWDNLRKERDFHRMHHRRVLQEKNELLKQLKRLKKYCDSFEPTINSLKSKYENAKKEKMLFRIDRDKMAVKMDAMEEQIRSIHENYNVQHNHSGTTKKRKSSSSASNARAHGQSQRSSHALEASTKSNNNENANENAAVNASNSAGGSLPPLFSGNNPFLVASNEEQQAVEAVAVEKFTMNKTLNVHEHAVSKIALHPNKDIVATASDDMSWKLWNLPDGELIMSGEGHTDWMSGLAFAPSGAQLATCSGDCSVKIWDFGKSCCVATFDEHTSVVWGVAYHFESSNHVVSCSMDHTIKLWDIEYAKCKQTYRGHVDSVNVVQFQPFSNNVVSASGDKTISFWDIRSALCIQTFYGHHNSINSVSFNRACTEIVSCDADGIVKIFDIRMIKEKKEINSGKYVHPASHVIFDESGKRAVVACDDAMIKVYDTDTGHHLDSLAGHQDNVNCLLFTHGSQLLVSCSSDCTLRLWQ